MHLTCTNMPVSALESALADVRATGVRNILALRGDPPKGQEAFTAIEGGYACALDLVRYIRQQHGDYFGITVAGYPEAHPDSIVDDAEQMAANYAANLAYLKQKVDAGAEVSHPRLAGAVWTNAREVPGNGLDDDGNGALVLC